MLSLFGFIIYLQNYLLKNNTRYAFAHFVRIQCVVLLLNIHFILSCKSGYGKKQAWRFWSVVELTQIFLSLLAFLLFLVAVSPSIYRKLDEPFYSKQEFTNRFVWKSSSKHNVYESIWWYFKFYIVRLGLQLAICEVASSVRGASHLQSSLECEWSKSFAKQPRMWVQQTICKAALSVSVAHHLQSSLKYECCRLFAKQPRVGVQQAICKAALSVSVARHLQSSLEYECSWLFAKQPRVWVQQAICKIALSVSIVRHLQSSLECECSKSFAKPLWMWV